MNDYKLPYHPLKFKGTITAEGIREAELTYDAENTKIIIGDYKRLNPKLLEVLEKAKCPYQKASLYINYNRVDRRKDSMSYDAYNYVLFCKTDDDEWRVFLELSPFSHRYGIRSLIEQKERELQAQRQQEGDT